MRMCEIPSTARMTYDPNAPLQTQGLTFQAHGTPGGVPLRRREGAGAKSGQDARPRSGELETRMTGVVV